MGELGFAAQRGAADQSACGQASQIVMMQRYKAIAYVFPRQIGF